MPEISKTFLGGLFLQAGAYFRNRELIIGENFAFQNWLTFTIKTT